jgi:MFS family permease
MFLAGVGHGTVMVLTNKALYDWFPRERLATAMGAKFVAMACSGIVAGTAMPTLALWVGWSSIPDDAKRRLLWDNGVRLYRRCEGL